jgi:hypothetical protein
VYPSFSEAIEHTQAAFSGAEQAESGIPAISPRLVCQGVLLGKIESNVGGRIDDLVRRINQADHVQAAESSGQAAELDHPGFTPFPGVHTPGFMMSPRSGARHIGGRQDRRSPRGQISAAKEHRESIRLGSALDGVCVGAGPDHPRGSARMMRRSRFR